MTNGRLALSDTQVCVAGFFLRYSSDSFDPFIHQPPDDHAPQEAASVHFSCILGVVM